MPESCSQELKLKENPSHNLLAAEMNTIGSVMCCENFGDLQRLLCVTAYVLRAVKQFKVKRSWRVNLPIALIPEEILASELLWITHVQRELTQQKGYGTLKIELRLFCSGPLKNADIPYAAKHPILLPRSHHFTSLVVKDVHIPVYHSGVKETLTEVRSWY